MADLKFLVVDDSLTMRRIVVNALKAQGYGQVMEAQDGKDAVAKIMSEGAGFVITDWNMPEMSGLEFIKAVRANEQTRHLPVLMVTTNASQDDLVAAMKAGVNNYVVKPFTADTIREKIEAALKS